MELTFEELQQDLLENNNRVGNLMIKTIERNLTVVYRGDNINIDVVAEIVIPTLESDVYSIEIISIEFNESEFLNDIGGDFTDLIENILIDLVKSDGV